MTKGALVAFRRIADAQRLGHALAALGNQGSVTARMALVFFLPRQHLVIPLAATVTTRGRAALPADKPIGGERRHGQSEESEQSAHAPRLTRESAGAKREVQG